MRRKPIRPIVTAFGENEMAMQYKLKDPNVLLRIAATKDFEEHLRGRCEEYFHKDYYNDVRITIRIPKFEIIAEDVCPEKAELEALKAQVLKAVECLSAGDIDGVWKALGAEP